MYICYIIHEDAHLHNNSWIICLINCEAHLCIFLYFLHQALEELIAANFNKNIFFKLKKTGFLLSKMKSFSLDDVVMWFIAVFLPVRVEKATVSKEHLGNIPVCSGGSQKAVWQLNYWTTVESPCWSTNAGLCGRY